MDDDPDAPREDRLTLPDGRILAWAEHGDPDGVVVLGCHGSPSSRLERHVEDPADYRRWGVRLVVPDRPGIGRSAVRAVLAGTFTEGLRNGPAALAEDRALFFRPWGFPLASVRQHVDVWHGTHDWQVPAALGAALAAMLPDCTPHWFPGEGHFLVFDHAPEVYGALLGRRLTPGLTR